jgi:hypothetical protein
MQHVSLGSVIQQAISKFNQNRIGEKPPVFVTIPPAVTHLPWHDGSAKQFVRRFLYEALQTNHPDAIIEIVVRRKRDLKDLNAFVGIQPSYWVQLRVSGRGLKIMEHSIQELFAEVDYRCEEWVGGEESSARLGIFGARDKPKLKMVFCLESIRNILKCDLLLPVFESFPLAQPNLEEAKPA